MAESKLRARLKRLFSTNVIVRHAGGKKLKIADIYSRVNSICLMPLIFPFAICYFEIYKKL